MGPNACLGEVTVFQKHGGPITKRITLVDGKVVNDSSACRMANGCAHRFMVHSVQALADLINGFTLSEAYTLGRLRDGLPDRVEVVRKDKLNAAATPSVIARTKEYLIFNEGEPGLVLLDVDFKGIPDATRRRLDECGGVWGALCDVLPALESVAFVERASTSSGLRNTVTGERFPSSGGCHIVIAVCNAGDIPRFLADFDDRCWLAGWGWGLVSAAGSFLERSIIDKSVGSSERLIFEGAPIVDPPLVQDPRNAIAHDGSVLDTRSCCPPLTDSEKATLQRLKCAEERRLLPQRQEARSRWSVEHIKRLVAGGMPEAEARAQVDRCIDRQELSGDFPLPFDDPSIVNTTVAAVLATPENYIDMPLSDPFEGPAYGRGKAILYRRLDGSLFIKSFAHGGIRYELKATPKTPGGPRIELRPGESERIVDEIEAALLASGRGLYRRGGAVVAVGFDRMQTWDGKTVVAHIIEERGDYALLEDFEATAEFLKFDKRTKKLMRCAPGLGLVLTFKQRRTRLHLPNLVGVVNCPSIRANGELVTTPGFDAATGILYDPLGIDFPPVPDNPTRALAEAALARIKRLLRTFPFESRHDLAVALSLFLTAIVRAFLPSAPFHGFDAPVAGAGKSLIVDIASILAVGHEAGVTAQGETREEAEKRLSTLLMRGDRLIAIDNCEYPVEGDLINQALTQTSVHLRILGHSQAVTVRCSSLITGTGNNLAVKGDLTRRSLVSRLDPKCERPELQQFDYDPIEDTKQNRGQFVIDCLTILRAYHCAGRPNPPPKLQSFVAWSNTVRASLIWLGEADPVATMDRLRDIDPVLVNLKTVLTAWRGRFEDASTTANQAVDAANATLAVPEPGTFTNVRIPTNPALRDALLVVAGRSGKIDIGLLGKWLGKHLGRVVDLGGGNFVAVEKAGLLHGNQRWRVVARPSQGGEGGLGGAVPNPKEEVSSDSLTGVMENAPPSPPSPPNHPDEHSAPQPAAARTSNGAEPGLSQFEIRELASWYLEEAYRRRNDPVLAADCALQKAVDGALRQRLAELGVPPEFIEVEFERVMQVAFAV